MVSSAACGEADRALPLVRTSGGRSVYLLPSFSKPRRLLWFCGQCRGEEVKRLVGWSSHCMEMNAASSSFLMLTEWIKGSSPVIGCTGTAAIRNVRLSGNKIIPRASLLSTCGWTELKTSSFGLCCDAEVWLCAACPLHVCTGIRLPLFG
ncbi:hypothetical protein AOLI_G00104450 [Acnodon oligacanthus]